MFFKDQNDLYKATDKMGRACGLL